MNIKITEQTMVRQSTVKNMQNMIRVTATGSPLQVLNSAPSVSQWHRSLSPSLPQGTSLQTGTELSGFCRFSNGHPPSSIFHQFKPMTSQYSRTSGTTPAVHHSTMMLLTCHQVGFAPAHSTLSRFHRMLPLPSWRCWLPAAS